ncbi:MAG: hypothetical protein GX654_04330 [Desulfatiglans sp.]|nr:hypothetical protein [Desulfatiglans sp.]
MNRRFVLHYSLLIFFLMAVTGIAMIPGFCSAASSKEPLITVMNPAITEKPAARVNIAPRLTTLDGKTIYLVDVNYEGISGTPVMGEIQRWFAKNMPKVKTVLKVKSGNYATDDPALWKEIKDNKGDGVILGVAG